MPDKKLTDNEIIKAFQLATIRAEHPGFVLCGQIVDLINRLQAENEEKDKNYIELLRTSSERAEIIGQKGAEIERLKTELDVMTEEHLDILNRLETAKAEAYKECIDMVKKKGVKVGVDEICIFEGTLDNFLKELVGDK